MGHWENKRQGHTTLPFTKIAMQHWGSPIKGPYIYRAWQVSHEVYYTLYALQGHYEECTDREGNTPMYVCQLVGTRT